MSASAVSQYNKLSLAEQFSSLKYCPLSNDGLGKLEKNYFYWEFNAMPTPLSKTYRVLIIFHINSYSPSVFVLDKEIWQVSGTKTIPHLYDFKKIKLCLYYPSYQEWTSKMPLCSTIVSWTYLWLYFYEEWLYSGEWKGGGIHPDNKSEDTIKNKAPNPLKNIRAQKKAKNKKNSLLTAIDKIYQVRKKAYLKEMKRIS